MGRLSCWPQYAEKFKKWTSLFDQCCRNISHHDRHSANTVFQMYIMRTTRVCIRVRGRVELSNGWNIIRTLDQYQNVNLKKLLLLSFSFVYGSRRNCQKWGKERWEMAISNCADWRNTQGRSTQGTHMTVYLIKEKLFATWVNSTALFVPCVLLAVYSFNPHNYRWIAISRIPPTFADPFHDP